MPMSRRRARLQRGFGEGVMGIVGCGDDDSIHLRVGE